MNATLLGLSLLAVLAGAQLAHAQDAATLQARHAAMHDALARNVFQRPLRLESSEVSRRLKGEVYARIPQPYAVVGPALQSMSHWCDILILHPNVKGCRAPGRAGTDTLRLNIGRKFDQPLADAYAFDFKYTVAESAPDYLRVVLSAAEGPLGTSRYRIVLEAAPLDGEGSFLHLTYSYVHGVASRWAAGVYLATIGRAKVGFSVVGQQPDGQPVYIGGTRGVIERNAMRCYLAIEAYLDSLSAPAADQVERRLTGWHAGVEQYSVQLHELDLGPYLAMKRAEILRQQAPPPSSTAQMDPPRSARLDGAPAPVAMRNDAADLSRSAP
jgi:hypothetical protein